VEGIDLLKAMEQAKEEGPSDIDSEEQVHLPQEIVENITKAKENSVNLNMEKYDKKRIKDPSWGRCWLRGREEGKIKEGLCYKEPWS
jgi:hypothetical protein